MFAAEQLLQGCCSVTSHLTLRELHVTQANFARLRGGSMSAGFGVMGMRMVADLKIGYVFDDLLAWYKVPRLASTLLNVGAVKTR